MQYHSARSHNPHQILSVATHTHTHTSINKCILVAPLPDHKVQGLSHEALISRTTSHSMHSVLILYTLHRRADSIPAPSQSRPSSPPALPNDKTPAPVRKFYPPFHFSCPWVMLSLPVSLFVGGVSPHSILLILTVSPVD